VNPLPVFRRFRKLLYPLLRNLEPLAQANLTPDEILQPIQICNYNGRHVILPLPSEIIFLTLDGFLRSEYREPL
jgi:hypothetical protein